MNLHGLSKTFHPFHDWCRDGMLAFGGHALRRDAKKVGKRFAASRSGSSYP